MKQVSILRLLLVTAGAWAAACGGNTNNDAHANANAGTSNTAIGGGSPTGGASRGSTTSESSIGGSSGSTGGASGSGGTTSAGGGTSSCNGCQTLEQCWNSTLCVAQSVSVPTGFTVDATEVTRGQYAAWLATQPATTGQAAFCTWNTSFAPDATCMADKAVCQGSGCANHPQPCVDWCDALSYCQAVGKRLCTQSEWDNVCTSNGVNEAVYGKSWAMDMCNDYTFNNTTTVPVGSMAGCQSSVAGYAGIFDLIGNLGEWTDNCFKSSGQSDGCDPRGLSFGMGAAAPVCSQAIPMRRGDLNATTGFRCCDSQ
jgi:formylglycine-generating enzyme